MRIITKKYTLSEIFIGMPPPWSYRLIRDNY